MRWLILLLLAATAACDGAPASSTSADAGPGSDAAGAGDSCGAVTRRCADILASFSAEAADIEVTCDDSTGTFTISASGLPNYSSNQSTPNMIGVQGWQVTLPLRPTCAASPEPVVASRGPIGLMVNGVAFYGPQNANGQDAPTTEAASLDDCDGHADMSCTYHYHSDPRCVFGTQVSLADRTLPDGHPALIGFALDGFALYAPDAADVVLDDCNGHSDATRGYHYHVTSDSPYFVGCLMGVKQQLDATDRGCD